MTKPNKNKLSAIKRSLLEWGLVIAVGAFIYAMGWHTQVIGTLQRGMLWTGLFDADTTEIATTEGPPLSESAYRFSMTTPNGERISLADYRGQVLFINLWASWCPPCIAEMPTIETLYSRVSGHKKIKFILLALDEDHQKSINFMKKRDFPMPYYFPAESLPSELKSRYLPTTYIISKEGRLIYKKEGIADYSSINFARWMRDLARRN